MKAQGTEQLFEASHSIEPRIDGAVLADTREALETGIGNERPLDPKVVDGAIGQATRILGRILGAYEVLVARGEVGPSGSGKASVEAGLSPQGATGLLYGKVQSGKTLAMIATAALALDNGFRVVVVLTSDNVELVGQTATRFASLQGALVRSSSNIGTWLEDVPHVASALREKGIVLVTAKNVAHLASFSKFLQDIGAADYPALILDDEADQATLDTNLRKRAQKNAEGSKEVVAASKIFDWTNGEGRSIRNVLPHNFYLQVTATPYALLLQNMDSKSRPEFTELLHPAEGYLGGEFFFASTLFGKDAKPPLRFVRREEASLLLKSKKDTPPPEGLDCALASFLVAATAQASANSKVKYQAQNFLVHTSAKKSEHDAVSDIIRIRLGNVYNWVQAGDHTAQLDAFLQPGLSEMAKSLVLLPSRQEIIAYVRRRFHDREVLVVNSEKDGAKFGPHLNFIVGGNILGRGLTINNLLCTYYLRSAKVAQMDTMLQHARMFGYREADRQYLRVFLPELEAARFNRIQVTERELRDTLEKAPQGRTAVEVAPGLRPTRLGVLDPYEVEAFGPGQHFYPTVPLKILRANQVDDAQSRKCHEEAKVRFLNTFFDSDSSVLSRGRKPYEERRRQTTIDSIKTAIDWLPAPKVDGERGSWHPSLLKRLLDIARQKFGANAWVYAREAERTTIVEGMLGSSELAALRNWGYPVLCLFWDASSSTKLEQRNDPKSRLIDVRFPYVFPELVLPKRLPTQVMNVDGLRE